MEIIYFEHKVFVYVYFHYYRLRHRSLFRWMISIYILWIKQYFLKLLLKLELYCKLIGSYIKIEIRACLKLLILTSFSCSNICRPNEHKSFICWYQKDQELLIRFSFSCFFGHKKVFNKTLNRKLIHKDTVHMWMQLFFRQTNFLELLI